MAKARGKHLPTASANIGPHRGRMPFIGDEPVWDFEGAVAAGMPAILIDRIDKHRSHNGMRIRNLEQVTQVSSGRIICDSFTP
jgi:hypothetical protein